MAKLNTFFKEIKPRQITEQISPIIINPSSKSITLSLSKRFIMFKLLENMKKKIENEPHLNFVSNLKSYKVLGRLITGTLHEMYRDRNNMYFKNFFIDREIHSLIKSDIEWVYSKYSHLKDKIKMTITKRGIVIYDNHEKNKFNVLVLTIHSGTWIRKDIADKQNLTPNARLKEEDMDTHKIYGPIAFQQSGIWIDNKASRFSCDYNRSHEKAIYTNDSEKFVKNLWKEELTESQRKWLLKGHHEFYFTLARLIDNYRFNIILDSHSMKNAKGRADISFGTRYIPLFYMPIVHDMVRKLKLKGYSDIGMNKPFYGGNILKWLSIKFPDVFVCSMEVNKKMYMNKNLLKSNQQKVKSISEDIMSLFNLNE